MKRFLILILFLIPAVVAFRPVQQVNEDVTMQVEGGIGGWYRAGEWVPLAVSVESTNATINGHLQVRVSADNNSAAQFETTYRTPFTIASGDSKRVFLYVSVNDFTRNVQVELVSDKGNVIVTAQSDLVQIGASDVLFVTVGDPSNDIVDISRNELGRGRNYQSNWRIDDIPPNTDALRSVDVLFFNDVDTARLSSDQRVAIENWVSSGGHLIITGGTNWQRTTGGLGRLLPTIPEGTETLDEVLALDAFVRVGTPGDLEVTTIATDNTPLDDADVLVEETGVPLVVRRKYGAGTVDFVALDANLEPLRSWDGTDRFWHELIISAPLRPTWSHGIERFNLAQDSVSNVEANLPAALQLLAFLVAYIMLIGPINYFVLQRLGKRELAWVSIPILIGGFTIYAYFSGFSLRGEAVTVNQIAVIQQWQGQELARVDAVFGVLSPRRTTYDVIMRDDLNLRSIPNEDGPGSLTQVSIVEGEEYHADNIPVDAAIMTNFATSGYIPSPNFVGEATWNFSLDTNAATIIGQVTNALDVVLEDAVILADDESVVLGNLQPGANVTFDLQVSLNNPVRLPLGNLADTAQPVLSTFNNARCVLPGTLNVTYENVMRSQPFECSGQSDEDREMRRRALLLAAVTNEIDRNGGRGSNVYLVGWTRTPPLNIELANAPQANSGTALYIYEIPSTLNFANADRVTLPPGLISWTQIEDDATFTRPLEANADLSFRLVGDQSVTVRFAPLSGAVLDTVTDIELAMRWRSRNAPVKVSLWNWDDALWDDIEITDANFSDNNELRLIIDDQAYLGSQNAIQVRIAALEQTISQEISNLRVTIHGTKRSS